MFAAMRGRARDITSHGISIDVPTRCRRRYIARRLMGDIFIAMISRRRHIEYAQIKLARLIFAAMIPLAA